MVKTAAVLVGNSDDKLTQSRWAEYVALVGDLVEHAARKVYFTGHSNPGARWQNACWVFEVQEEDLGWLRLRLAHRASEFGQDSIALVLGQSELIPAEWGVG